jgi:hypothetical protein
VFEFDGAVVVIGFEGIDVAGSKVLVATSIYCILSSWTPSSGGIFFDRSYIYFF